LIAIELLDDLTKLSQYDFKLLFRNVVLSLILAHAKALILIATSAVSD
jgi:hypothetical protein